MRHDVPNRETRYTRTQKRQQDMNGEGDGGDKLLRVVCKRWSRVTARKSGAQGANLLQPVEVTGEKVVRRPATGKNQDGVQKGSIKLSRPTRKAIMLGTGRLQSRWWGGSDQPGGGTRRDAKNSSLRQTRMRDPRRGVGGGKKTKSLARYGLHQGGPGGTVSPSKKRGGLRKKGLRVPHSKWARAHRTPTIEPERRPITGGGEGGVPSVVEGGRECQKEKRADSTGKRVTGTDRAASKAEKKDMKNEMADTRSVTGRPNRRRRQCGRNSTTGERRSPGCTCFGKDCKISWEHLTLAISEVHPRLSAKESKKVQRRVDGGTEQNILIAGGEG